MDASAMELLRKVSLPIALTNSNDGRGHSFWRSNSTRKNAEALLRSSRLLYVPFTFPVVVHVTRMLSKGQRFWDSSSIGRGNWKEIEDAMVVCGWFHDDSHKWIKETRFFQSDADRGNGGRIVVEIYKADSVSEAY